LKTSIVEILGAKPTFDMLFDLWPFMVEHAVPGRVPALSLHNHVLPENALKAKTKAKRRPS
jgi:hypothetical protein